MLLSVVIPVYNEEKTINEMIKRVRAVNLPAGLTTEIIIVDDCSTDQTKSLLAGLVDQLDIKIFYQTVNKGKGAALIEGFKQAQGDFIVIQDADLEYDPNDYNRLLAPLLAGEAEVVYGSRYLAKDARRVYYFWHTLFNKFLTLFSNICSDLYLTDEATCYKMFSRNALLAIRDRLSSPRFGIDPQITAYIAKAKLKVWEVSVRYTGRAWIDGKKINWRDGLAAFWHIIRFNLLSK